MFAVAFAAAFAACSNRAARSAPVSLMSFTCLAGCQRRASLGQVRSAASFPPEYQTGVPSLVTSPFSATAYPVTWPGLFVL